MVEKYDLKELQLVEKAVKLGKTTRGCCEWQEKAALRVRKDPDCQGLTPEGIRGHLIDFVTNGGVIRQVVEQREPYRDHRDYYYKAIIPIVGFPRGLFVEIILSDDDIELPSVEIVNAHPQRS
jgi:hypothetical protein